MHYLGYIPRDSVWKTLSSSLGRREANGLEKLTEDHLPPNPDQYTLSTPASASQAAPRFLLPAGELTWEIHFRFFSRWRSAGAAGEE